eukprot:5902761-Karenia_brevis.AAC.1
MLAHYRRVSVYVAEEEGALHRTLHKDVEAIVKETKILLFKRMLEDIGYDDMAVVDYLVEGVK